MSFSVLWLTITLNRCVMDLMEAIYNKPLLEEYTFNTVVRGCVERIFEKGLQQEVSVEYLKTSLKAMSLAPIVPGTIEETQTDEWKEKVTKLIDQEFEMARLNIMYLADYIEEHVDMNLIRGMALNGVRADIMYITSVKAAMQQRFKSGLAILSVGTPKNPKGSLEWYTLHTMIQRGQAQEQINEQLNLALANEVYGNMY